VNKTEFEEESNYICEKCGCEVNFRCPKCGGRMHKTGKVISYLYTIAIIAVLVLVAFVIFWFIPWTRIR